MIMIKLILICFVTLLLLGCTSLRGTEQLLTLKNGTVLKCERVIISGGTFVCDGNAFAEGEWVRSEDGW